MPGKQFAPEEKSRLVLQAIRGERTINEIASENNIHPNVLSRWKSEAEKNLYTLFQDSSAKEHRARKAHEAELQELYALLGLNRSGLYCKPEPPSGDDLRIKAYIDKIYTQCQYSLGILTLIEGDAQVPRIPSGGEVRVRIHADARLLAEPCRKLLQQDDEADAEGHQGAIERGAGSEDLPIF